GYPRLQPHPEILPSASPRASSGRNAATRFSPVLKQKFEAMTSAIARASVSAPVKASAAVKRTQPAGGAARRSFFAARRAAYAPRTGAGTRTRAEQMGSAIVHAHGTPDALPATTPTK